MLRSLKSAFLVGLIALAAFRVGLAEPGIGILVVAHGGQAVWNEHVRQAVVEARLSQPVEVVFGMGMASEVPAWQEAVRRLETQGVKRVVVLPLLVSSHSEVYRQIAYLFGQRSDPAPELTEGEPVKPIETKLEVTLIPALDDHRLVGEILLERARSLSRNPKEESVVLVAHGPVGDADNRQWLETIARHTQVVAAQGGFRQVVGATLRDDAPVEIRNQATEELRWVIQQLSGFSRVIVVPLLLSEGGIENGIVERLKGLEYQMVPQGLLPHPKISEWIKRQVGEGQAPGAR